MFQKTDSAVPCECQSSAGRACRAFPHFYVLMAALSLVSTHSIEGRALLRVDRDWETKAWVLSYFELPLHGNKAKSTTILGIPVLILNNHCLHQQKSWICSLMVIILCICFYTEGLVSINRSCYSNYFLLVIPICSIWKQPVYFKGSHLWVLFCCLFSAYRSRSKGSRV